MRLSVAEAAQQLEARGLLTRERHDDSERVIAHVRTLLGRELPLDLVNFYRERIDTIGQFWAQTPAWNERVGWQSDDTLVTVLAHVDAVPVFDDGCGGLYGLDLTPGIKVPAVYYFDHEREFREPEWAAGSSLGTFMLLLAEHDRAYREEWPERWELKIDPDLERCPRAPAIWAAG